MKAPKQWGQWQGRFFDKHLPPQSVVQLGLKNILVFPTKKGLLFLITVVIIFILGTNYQNSLMVMFAQFMLSLMLVSVGFTFSNLSALQVRCVGADPAYAGQTVVFKFHVSVPKNLRNPLRPRIQVRTKDDSDHDVATIEGHGILNLCFESRYRGWFQAPRIRIETVYPLGLMCAWSYPLAEGGGWIYPTPIKPGDAPVGVADQDDGIHPSREHGDEWDRLSPYRPGDNMSHIHWKSLAQGKELHTKHFTRPANRTVWIDWEDYPSTAPEIRLSWLCHRVRELSKLDQPFGLRLPNFVAGPDISPSHRSRCLLALAQFGRPGPSSEHLSADVKPFPAASEVT